MDLDSLKERSKSLRAPQFGSAELAGESPKLDGLVARLKDTEKKEYERTKKALTLWIIAIALLLFSLAGALLATETQQLLPTLILRVMTVLLFATVAILAYVKIRKLSKVDYTEPVRTFLDKAESRFSFARWNYFALVYLLIIVISYGAHFYISYVLFRYFDIQNSWLGFAITLVFFTLVFFVGIAATKSGWNRERAPLLEEIRKMRAELGAENGSDSGS
jgi:hypothetical protein